MKTREEVIQALKPAKIKYIIMILLSLWRVSMPVITIFFHLQQYQEDYQSLLEENYYETIFQEKVDELETAKKEELQVFGIVAIGEILMICLVWFVLFHNKNARKNKKLIKAIEDETILIQSAKITGFRCGEQRRNNGSSYGYYVIAKNGDKSFESDFLPLSSATLYNSAGQELHPHGEEINFSMIMNAVKKYKETWSQEAMMQQFEQDVKEQNPASWEDNYLEYQGNTYHIGENVEIYIDPDNESQYYVNI